MTAVTGDWLYDDDKLLAALRDALRAGSRVPASFVEAGKASYTWRLIDAELAALTYDSARDEDGAALTRAGPASLRTFSFVARQLRIELQVSEGTLRGQVVPPQSGDVELHTARHRVSVTPVDEVGYFGVGTVPAGSFRLLFRTAEGNPVLTDWIVL